MNMAKETKNKTLSKFLQTDFSRISDRLAKEICDKAGLDADGCLPGQAHAGELQAAAEGHRRGQDHGPAHRLPFAHRRQSDQEGA